MRYELLTLEQINLLEPYKTGFNEDELKHYIYSKSFYDIEFFSDFFLKHLKTIDGRFIKTPGFHKEIWDLMDEYEQSLAICPRGHGKTTGGAVIKLLHELLYKEEWTILYVSSGSLGEETIGKIKTELETNTILLEIYGKQITRAERGQKIKEGQKKWRQKFLQLRNGNGIETISKGQSIRGKRPKRIVIDDPEENKDVSNKKNSEKTRDWLFTSAINTLLPGGKITVLGTIIGKLCLVKYLKEVSKWKTVEYTAILPNGEALFPGLWPLEELEKRRLIIGTGRFNQEFMNIPLSKTNCVIKDEWIKLYNERQLPKEFDKIVMAVDPAVSEKEAADFTGISIVGKKGENKYVIYSDGLKLSPGKLEPAIIALYKRYKPNKLIEETNIERKLFEDLKKKGLAMQGIYAHRDKHTRLMEVAAQIEFGNVYFRDNGKDDELIYQLTTFPDVEHDDIMDSLVYALKGLEEEEQQFWMS